MTSIIILIVGTATIVIAGVAALIGYRLGRRSTRLLALKHLRLAHQLLGAGIEQLVLDAEKKQASPTLADDMKWANSRKVN